MEGEKRQEQFRHERPQRMSASVVPRSAGLDGLRAMAIMLVFLRHNAYFFLEAQEKQPEGTPLWNVMLNGWIGVDLFFVLSGYLITASLLRSRQHDWKIYAQKRFLRIFPAYAGVLALCAAGAFPMYSVAHDDLPWRIFYHLLFLQDYLPADINVVFWSLGVEEKFYIVAPFLIFWLARRGGQGLSTRSALLILAMLFTGYCLRLLSFSLADPQSYVAFFTSSRAPFHANWETLLLGVAIAFWAAKKGDGAQPRASLLFYVGLAAMLALMASHEMMREIGLFDVLLQPVLVAACMALLVFSVVGGYSNALLDNPVARYLSRISYSLYLVHFPLAPATLYLWHAYGMGSFATYSMMYLVVSLAVAAVLHVALEKPFLKIKDRLTSPP